jgi:hypothetical protein
VKHRLFAIVPFALLALCGCTSTPDAGATARAYPQAMPQFGTLDIQVFRRSREVEFTNTTPRAFGPSTIWINRRSIAVGETVTLPLEAFVDENGERFRAGGFFAAYIPDIIALAQLETSGTQTGTTPDQQQTVLLGLITVKAGAD